MHRSRTARLSRRAALLLFTLSLSTALLFAISLRTTRSVTFNRYAIGIGAANIELASASHPIKRTGRVWTFPTGNQINAGGGYMWTPSSSLSTLSMTSGGITTSFKLTIRFIPIAPIAILLAAPVIPLWLLSRHLRVAPGHCPACGYDLRATPTGPCPECGRAPARSAFALVRRWLGTSHDRRVLPAAPAAA